MKTLELLKSTVKGLFDLEQCGIATFETAELGQLVEWFGHGIDWHGQFVAGTYMYVYHDESVHFDAEEVALEGYPISKEDWCISLFLCE